MIEPIIYREMRFGEEQAVCNLAMQVFNKYVAIDYAQDGIDEFFCFSDPNAMKERLQLNGFVLVAYQSDVLLGMLEFFPPDCIAMLFVSSQQQGIAKNLLSQAIIKARALNPSLNQLCVHSSPYAEPIYQKMGFHKIGGVTTENGIKYIPMELLLKSPSAE